MPDAEQTLRELIDKIALERNYKNHEINVKAITSGGANYTSALFLVTIKFPDKKDVNLFAKVAIIGEKLRTVMGASRLFYLEGLFYNQLAKTYTDLQLKFNISTDDMFVYPEFYGCNKNLLEETIVLENLIARGYGSYSRFSSIDWDHGSSAVEALAKFHALSFAYQKEKPEEFEEICKDLVFVMPELNNEQREGFWAKMMERSVAVVKEEDKAKITQFMDSKGMEIFRKLREPISAKVIAHGDYRPSNLLFKRQGTKVHTMPIDYQTIHVGCPAADLIYFEVCGTDSKFRAEYHDRLMNHYYEQLSAALQRLGVDPNEVYSRETFDAELKEMLPFAVLIGIVLLPVVLVEAENAPRIDRDAELDSFFVQGNDLYAERFRGIIEDCVRWGCI